MSCHYTVFGQEQAETPIQRGLSILFNNTKMFTYKKVKPDLLEWLDSGCLSLRFYAVQEDTDDPALHNVSRRLSRMTTVIADDSMRSQMRGAASGPSATLGVSITEDPHLPIADAALKARIAELERQLANKRDQDELQNLAVQMSPSSERMAARSHDLERELQQAHLKYVSREKRMLQALDMWKAKPAEEKDFDAFYESISGVIKAPDKFKRIAGMVGGVQVAYSSLYNASPAASPMTKSLKVATSARTGSSKSIKSNKSTKGSKPKPASAEGGSKACVIQ